MAPLFASQAGSVRCESCNHAPGRLGSRAASPTPWPRRQAPRGDGQDLTLTLSHQRDLLEDQYFDDIDDQGDDD